MKKKITGVRNVLVSTSMQLFAAMVMAAIRAVLQMQDPMALPYAVSLCPAYAANEETMTSGMVVPMETIVAPMRISGILNLWAMPTAPSTNQSPPLIRRTKPIRKSTIGKIISLNIA